MVRLIRWDWRGKTVGYGDSCLFVCESVCLLVCVYVLRCSHFPSPPLFLSSSLLLLPPFFSLLPPPFSALSPVPFPPSPLNLLPFIPYGNPYTVWSILSSRPPRCFPLSSSLPLFPSLPPFSTLILSLFSHPSLSLPLLSLPYLPRVPLISHFHPVFTVVHGSTPVPERLHTHISLIPSSPLSFPLFLSLHIPNRSHFSLSFPRFHRSLWSNSWPRTGLPLVWSRWKSCRWAWCRYRKSKSYYFTVISLFFFSFRCTRCFPSFSLHFFIFFCKSSLSAHYHLLLSPSPHPVATPSPLLNIILLCLFLFNITSAPRPGLKMLHINERACPWRLSLSVWRNTPAQQSSRTYCRECK